MTDEQLAITEWAAKWLGWECRVFGEHGMHAWHPGKSEDNWPWRPFTDLNDTHLLLVECNDRGLLPAVVKELIRTLPPPDYENPELDCEDGMLMGLLATAEQQTLAVWEVAKLEQGKDGT